MEHDLALAAEQKAARDARYAARREEGPPPLRKEARAGAVSPPRFSAGRARR